MRNGNDAAGHARKRKQTAQAAIDTHKRMTAGLHFAVGNTCLGPPLFEHMLEIKTPASNPGTKQEAEIESTVF